MLGVTRNHFDPEERISDEDRAIMHDLDELLTRWPVYVRRKLAVELCKRGREIGCKRVRRLMEIMGIAAVAPKPRTSVPDQTPWLRRTSSRPVLA